MRRSWDPIDFVGAPLIPSPASNRSAAHFNGSRKPFQGEHTLLQISWFQVVTTDKNSSQMVEP